MRQFNDFSTPFNNYKTSPDAAIRSRTRLAAEDDPALLRARLHHMKLHSLFIVLGQPASGKSTLSRVLSARLNAAYFDIDTATESLVRAALEAMDHDPDDRDSEFFKKQFREAIYETLFDLAKANLSHTDVVVSGPFTKEFADPNWLETVQRRLAIGARIQAVHTHCSPERLERRMRERNNPRDRGKLANWGSYVAYYQAAPTPLFPHLTVDTGDSESVERALATLLCES